MPNPLLRFFIYLEDQTNVTSTDQLGPVSVEFYERKVDGADAPLPCRIVDAGNAFANSLAVPGATQLFQGEDPLNNASSGVLADRYKPWADVWVEYVPLPLPPPVPPPAPPLGPQQHRRDTKSIELERADTAGGFDWFLVVKRTLNRAPTEIGRSELFRNCKQDLSDLSPPGKESHVWVGVPSVGNERPLAVSSTIEYERVRDAAAKVLSLDNADLGALPDSEIEELAAQSVAGLDTIGLPPTSPAKTLYDPNANTDDVLHDASQLKQQSIRLRQQGEVDKRRYAIEQAVRERSPLVAALNGGFACQEWTKDAVKTRVFHWEVPVDPADWNAANPNTVLRVDVTAVPAGTLAVPAAYFYVVGRDLGSLTPALDRYNMAVGGPETNLRTTFRDAESRKLIPAATAAITRKAVATGAAVNQRRAARTLSGLSRLDLDEQPQPGTAPAAIAVSYGTCSDLFPDWLAADKTNEAYWADFAAIGGVNAKKTQHLAIVRQAACAGIVKPGQPDFASYLSGRPGWDAMQGVADLKAKGENDWRVAFADYWGGVIDDGPGGQQWQTLLSTVRRYLDPASPPVPASPMLAAHVFTGSRPNSDALQNFFNRNAGFDFATTTVAAIRALPETADVIGQLLILFFLYRVTRPGASDSVLVPRMEALYFRGFIDPWPIARLTAAQFRGSLVGTLAYADAAGIRNRAIALTGLPEYPEPPGDDRDRDGPPADRRVFRPVNYDGLLTDCVPPDHLSPFGPAAYVSALLRTALPAAVGVASLGAAVADRRGPLDALEVTDANTFTPVPAIDLVNETLESLVGQAQANVNLHPNGELPAGAAPSIFQTSDASSADALLASPEHSTPSSPAHAADEARQRAAYDLLRQDFSSFDRPYHQPLDIMRSYLQHMGTGRYETMRTFRKDIHEFVKQPRDMANPKAFTPFLPPDFASQTHLRRYPVRIDTAREYLKISEEEHREVFTAPLSGSRQKLWQFWGYPSNPGDTPQLPGWLDTTPGIMAPDPNARPAGVRRLAEFLKRSGLSYAEFRDLAACGLVPIAVAPGMPEQEPCDLGNYTIDFAPLDAAIALERLAVFLRLRRILRALPHTGYTFEGIFNHLSKARQQMLTWEAVRTAVKAVQTGVQTFMKPFEAAGAMPIAEVDRVATRDAIAACFDDLPAAYASIGNAPPVLIDLQTRLNRLVASANAQATQEIKDLARRVLANLAVADVAGHDLRNITDQVGWLTGDISAGKTKQSLMLRVRELRVSLKDFADNLVSLRHLEGNIAALHDLLPAAGVTVIRQAKAQAAEAVRSLEHVADVQAATTTAASALDNAMAWAPAADSHPTSDDIAKLLHELTDAIGGQLKPLRIFPDAVEQTRAFLGDLRNRPRDDSFGTPAMEKCERFLGAFDGEVLKNQIASGMVQIRAKIDALPAAVADTGTTYADLQLLIDTIAAEPVDGAFAGSLARTDATIAWWASQAKRDRSFLALKQICDVLGLYKDPPAPAPPDGTNSDFIRQLAAMQMLRDDYALCLSDVLPLWLAPGGVDDPRSAQAKSDLAAVIQERADCVRKEPKSSPLLSDHFGQIADLSSLRADAGNDNYPAFLQPTHTLRFVEICFKVAHSEFSIAELAFLYLNRHAVPFQDDPFHLDDNAATLAKRPFADKFSSFTDASLLRLQKLVRGAAYGSILPDRPDGKASDGPPSWKKGERKVLADKLKFAEADLLRLDRVFAAERQPAMWPSGHPEAADVWPALAEQLKALGYSDPDLEALKNLLTNNSPQFSAPLPQASVRSNYTYTSPFSYDAANNKLSISDLLAPADVLAEVTRYKVGANLVDPCSRDEVTAIRDLFEQPRRTLARFSLILPDQREAARRILKAENDAADRMRVFVRYFYVFFRQYLAVADHLAAHVLQQEPGDGDDSKLAGLSVVAQYLLLQHIEADENWKDNTGAFHYTNDPNAKAIAGILGLRGTGIWTEFSSFKQQPGNYADALELFNARFEQYVAKVPQVPAGAIPPHGPANAQFEIDGYEKLAHRPYPDFPTIGDFEAKPRRTLVREISGSLNYIDHPKGDFGTPSEGETHDWFYNAPKPLRVPEPINHAFVMGAGRKGVELRSGYIVRLDRDANSSDALSRARQYGGGLPYLVHWSGLLDVTTGGEHRFVVSLRLAEGEKAPLTDDSPIRNLSDDAARLVVTDAAGTTVAEVDIHRKDGGDSDDIARYGGDDDSKGVFYATPVLTLPPGQYKLELAFTDLSIDPSLRKISRENSADRHVAWVGVFVNSPDWDQLSTPKLAASLTLPKASDASGKVPFHEVLAQSLFIPKKTAPDDFVAERNDGAFFYPTKYYFSSIRDIRRSYQRAFKALLFCHRFGLNQAEVAFLLSKGRDFRGIAFTRQTGAWQSQQLDFDFNQWSVGDAFEPPAAGDDERQYPETHMPGRVWPLFDQWERFHDYVALRALAPQSDAPLWKLFARAADAGSPPTAADLVVQRLGLTAGEAADALRYTTDQDPDFDPLDKPLLKTEEWPIRIWQSGQWQRAKERRFAAATTVPPVEYRGWARLAPYVASLSDYIQGAHLENGSARRYRNLQELNDPLRQRARAALVGYLTTLGRCSFPQSAGLAPFAASARDLSERLLFDVETGACAASPRMENASAALRSFVQRLRLGLEQASPDDVDRDFLSDWDIRLAEYPRWQAWQYRTTYAENYRESYLIDRASGTDSFQFLEQQLPQLSLAVEESWEDPARPLLPAIPDLIRWEDRLPSSSQALPSHPEGYRDLNERERTLRRTAASVDRGENSKAMRETNLMRGMTRTPLEMDRRFLRIQCSTSSRQDDFYFWLVDGGTFDQVPQDASWGWDAAIDRNDYLAGIAIDLLAWSKRKTVRLAWCRLRDGIEDDVRLSDYGLPVSDAASVGIEFDKRDGDLLVFLVDGACKPQHRFVYDPGENVARILANWTILTVPHDGGLPSFPHFIATVPGEPAAPATFEAPVLLVQKHLRLKGETEAAREWLEFLYKPLARSNGWLDPDGLAGRANARVLLLNWLETVLELAEAQFAAHRLATTELSRETLALVRKVLGQRPRKVAHNVAAAPVNLAAFVPDAAPLNCRVARLWDRAELLAAAIAGCENSRHLRDTRVQPALPASAGGLPAYAYGRMPYERMWGSEYQQSHLDRDEWLIPPPHYRFGFLLQQAVELCADARGFGSLLISAFEKGDAEELALLHSKHEVQINRLLLDVRQSQWREADWQFQALQKAREVLELKKRHVQQLISAGLNFYEAAYFIDIGQAESLTTQAGISDGVAQVLLQIPEVYVGICSMVKVVSGQKISAGVRIASDLLHMRASISNMESSIHSMHGSFARREEEWRHQADVLAVEIEQVKRQILAADRRRDIALRELNIHEDSILNMEQVQQFQENKFSNAEHYLWTQDRLAGLYRTMFAAAVAAARDAEAAFRYERHYSPSRFVGDVGWTNYREGMTAGEQLLMGLRRMEQAYLKQNVREYELGKSISLRLSAPDALVALRLTGACEVELPEWMFDLELPGQYCRRIKNAAISILCATGPYQTVNARLTLLSDLVRLSPTVYPEYAEQVSLAGDPRFVRRYAAHQSIVTTSGQNDTGLFETNLRDERYLPFEGAGLVSRWRIEVDPTVNQFDSESLFDVVLHFRFTAIEGGSELRRHAQDAAWREMPSSNNPGIKYLDVRQDLPAEWLNFRENETIQLSLQINREMFPWSRNSTNLVVEGIELFLRPADGETVPPKLQVQANGQGSELLLVDLAYGPVYHGKVKLLPPVVTSGDASSSVQVEFGAPKGFKVPRPDVLLVPLKYYFAAPVTQIAPCDRFVPVYAR
jgi:hypothetical protein